LGSTVAYPMFKNLQKAVVNGVLWVYYFSFLYIYICKEVKKL